MGKSKTPKNMAARARNWVQCQAQQIRFYSIQSKPNFRLKNPAKKNHAFQELFPWKTKAQFIEVLAKNVIYNQDGIIAINKPYGVPVQKKSQVFGENESLFSIEEALKDLAGILGHERIVPAKVTERFTSGISLLTYHEAGSSKIRKCFINNRSMQIPAYKYVAVTVGELQAMKYRDTVGLGWLTHSDYPGKVPYIMRNYSKKNVKEGLIHQVQLQYRIISQNSSSPMCNLVEMETSSNKNHILRVYMSDCLSPVLGDHLYGNRVQEIMGTRLALGPVLADNLSTFQKIPVELLTRMQVKDSSSIPHCMHLSQITLAGFNKSEHLVLNAEAPSHFQSACTLLGLAMDDQIKQLSS